MARSYILLGIALSLILAERAQKIYSLTFQKDSGWVMLSFDKSDNSGNGCIVFSEEEKDKIEKLNLNECRLFIKINERIIDSFRIVSPNTSKVFKERRFLLCDSWGKLKMSAPICIE